MFGLHCLFGRVVLGFVVSFLSNLSLLYNWLRLGFEFIQVEIEDILGLCFYLVILRWLFIIDLNVLFPSFSYYIFTEDGLWNAEIVVDSAYEFLIELRSPKLLGFEISIEHFPFLANLSEFFPEHFVVEVATQFEMDSFSSFA